MRIKVMSDLEYYEDGVCLYQGLPDDIDSLSSYQAIQNITTPPLDSGQCLDLLRSLFAKRFSVFYNTGLGKTLVASAFMKALKSNLIDLGVKEESIYYELFS